MAQDRPWPRRAPELLRVGLLHFTVPPVVGGVERLLETHARLLADKGHQVALLAGRGGQRLAGSPVTLIPELDSKHQSVLRLNESLAKGEVPTDFDRLAGCLEARLEDELRKLDVCFVHNAFTLHFNLALTVALHRLAGRVATRLVAWCHDLSWANPLYQSLLRDREPWALLKTPAPGVRYVVVSEDRRTDLSRLAGLPPSMIQVIPGAVDLVQMWKLSRAGYRLLTELALLDADPFMLLPVRVTRRKNIELAIRVVGALRAAGLRPRLLVTGPPGPHDIRSGDYADELLHLRESLGLEREVVFLFEQADGAGRPKRVSDRIMADLFQAADLLFFPSSQEGFGLPILEAGINRLPVFAADIPPLRETAGAEAHFFRLDDKPERIAASIVAYVRQDRHYRLRKRIVRQYTWDHLYSSRIAPLLDPGGSEGVTLDPARPDAPERCRPPRRCVDRPNALGASGQGAN